MSKERLSKVLARAGVASRRKCEALIFEGKVQVNDQKILTPQHLVSLSADQITVNDIPITNFEKKVYYLLHKPIGYVCTHDRNLHSKLVVDLLPKKQRLFTVGRLDKETTGLLIVTNDGQLAHQIAHPSFEVEKEYLVKIDRDLTDQDLKQISSGVTIEGIRVIPLAVQKVRKGTLKVTVKEGKKHEVRLLVAQIGASIRSLSRIRIGNLRLGTLEMGMFKKVSLDELKKALFL